MEYHFQITLKKIEITNPDVKDPKVLAELTHAESTKRIANPRFIRNRIGSFYLQRLSVSTGDIRGANSLIVLKISSLSANSSSGERQIGKIEFDLRKLFFDIQKESTKTESCHNELRNFNIEYDLLLCTKKNQESYISSQSQDSLSIEKSQETIGAYSTPVETPVVSNLITATFEKKDSSNKVGLDYSEKKLEKTLSKARESSNSPTLLQNSPLRRDYAEIDDKIQDSPGEKLKKSKITRKQSGGSAQRSNVFKSKRGLKGSDQGDARQQNQQSYQRESPDSPAQVTSDKFARTSSQKQKPQQKTQTSDKELFKSTISPPKLMTPPKSSMSPKEFGAQKSVTPKALAPPVSPTNATGHVLKKQTLLTTPGNHKVRLIVQGQNEQPAPVQQVVVPEKHVPTTKESHAPGLLRKQTPPPQNPPPRQPGSNNRKVLDRLKSDIQVIPEENSTWKKKLPPIIVPEPDFENDEQTRIAVARHVTVVEDPDLHLTKQSQSQVETKSTGPKKRSSLKLPKDGESGLTKKNSRVRYAENVHHDEIQAEIKKYEGLFSKSDLKQNILCAFIALIVGYIIGAL